MEVEVANNDTSPNQSLYYSDQDILYIDIDDIYNNLIVPIDKIRSHFNATIPVAAVAGSGQLNEPQYQESRCSAFYRMLGFPVVAPDGSALYSPGFDKSLNSDPSTLNSYKQLASLVISSTFTTQQLNFREQIFRNYRNIFSSGGTNAQAVMLGSWIIRSFAHQFSDSITDPFQADSQTQNIDLRGDYVLEFFPEISTTLLQSVHLLKPFVVDPRFDFYVKPVANRMAAPFLPDKSDTVFDASSPNLLRPYIERVITVRFNTKDFTQDSSTLQAATDIIKNSDINDPTLISAFGNLLQPLHNDELSIFQEYVKLIQALIDTLIRSINTVEAVIKQINFQPIPDPQNGPETGIPGNTLNPVSPNDSNNQTLELNYVSAQVKKTLSDLTLGLDVGLQGQADPGDFAFSNLDDVVMNPMKNTQKSYDDILQDLTNQRNNWGNDGIEALKAIEIIMGEFSGLGAIDVVAIQAALWIMDSNSLVSLIDDRAVTRAQKYRPNINLSNFSRVSPTTALQNFQQTLAYIYKFIQDYYDSILSGTAFIVNS